MVSKPKKPYYIIGIDEVGRGPLAGPVCLCAVAMKIDKYKKMKWNIAGFKLTDSKKMTKNGREIWFKQIENNKDIKKAIAYRSATQIDKIGISKCIKDCIEEILDELNIKDPKVLLDGSLYAPESYKNQQTIIKGDLKKKVISLASVYAKVSRDKLMTKLSKKFPKYGWDRNMGYGSREHISAIKAFGTTKIHRRTFLTKILEKVE